MGIRPAKTCRVLRAQPWTRVSKRKPRKSFVKGVPNSKVRQFNMGTDKRYELEVDLVAQTPIQVRDNSIEAARQAANKYLEKKLFANFYLQVVAYPHLVLREHSALGVAGADRISKGMKRAFGRPKGRMARIHAGEVLFRARIMAKDLTVLKKALDRAMRKISGKWKWRVRDITSDSLNMTRKEHVFKKKEIEKPKEETPAAAAAAAAPAEGKAEEAAPAEEKKSGKGGKK
ncbi:50S ribosomal protein L10e [Candidatus Norongarragalina meridionalis]|nr:50S ribosomal protein L10e [Candidatus Norongarragalina meridionalis]